MHNVKEPLDEELNNLLSQAIEYIRLSDLNEYIKRVKRFNRPQYKVYSERGEYSAEADERLVSWFQLRKDLALFPQYFKAIQKASMTQTEAVDLLFKTVETYDDDMQGGPSILIDYLTKTIENCVARKFDFQNFIPEFEGFLEVLKKEGNIQPAFGFMRLGTGAGIAPTAVIQIASNICQKTNMASYVLDALSHEFYDLATNAVDGNLLLEILQKVMHGQPFWQGDCIVPIREMLYIGAIQTEKSQTEIITEALSATIQTVSGKPSADLIITKAPQNYFPEIPGDKLMHGLLPYRKEKSLVGGLTDLEKLMKTEYSEGAFIFDPQNELWYSFGGRTHINVKSVSNEFVPYNLARLSSDPVYVGIHSEECEFLVKPDERMMPYPELQYKITKFISAMPSSADFGLFGKLLEGTAGNVNLSALIVAPAGIAEIEFPNNANALKFMATQFRDLKDTVLTDFDDQAYLEQYGLSEKPSRFVQRLLLDLNPLLPTGFKITLHDYNDLKVLEAKYGFTMPQQSIILETPPQLFQ